MRWRSSRRQQNAHHAALDLVGDEAGSESGQHEHHTLRHVERRQREQRAGGHLAPADEGERQDHILHRGDASSEHRQPEIEPQRGEDDEHRIDIGGGALQRVHRVHLARTEQNEDARDAGLDKRVQESQPPRQGLALLEPAGRRPDGWPVRSWPAGPETATTCRAHAVPKIPDLKAYTGKTTTSEPDNPARISMRVRSLWRISRVSRSSKPRSPEAPT